METTMASSSIRKRTARRGAALVEAAVVIPTMLVFLGCIVFSYRSYDKKLSIQTSSRSSVLSYASHNCEGGAPTEVSLQGGEADINADTSQLDSAAGELRDSERAGTSRTLNIAHSSASAQVSGSAVVSATQKAPLQRTVSAKSGVACNEKRYDNQWTALIEFAVNFAKTGAGLGW
jgi:hypothetical protein